MWEGEKHPYWELLKLIKDNNSTTLLEVEVNEEEEERCSLDERDIEEDYNEDDHEREKITSKEDVNTEEKISCCICMEQIIATDFLKHVDDCENQKKPEYILIVSIVMKYLCRMIPFMSICYSVSNIK